MVVNSRQLVWLSDSGRWYIHLFCFLIDSTLFYVGLSPAPHPHRPPDDNILEIWYGTESRIVFEERLAPWLLLIFKSILVKKTCLGAPDPFKRKLFSDSQSHKHLFSILFSDRVLYFYMFIQDNDETKFYKAWLPWPWRVGPCRKLSAKDIVFVLLILHIVV